MGAIAGVVGSALSATGQSGQKGDMQQNNVPQASPVSNNNNGNNLPDIKEAKVEKAAEPVGGTTEIKGVEAPKAEGAGKMDWGKLSKLADGLTSSQGSPAPITANNVSNTQPIANFR